MDDKAQHEFLELAEQNRKAIAAGLFTDAEEAIQKIFELVEQHTHDDPSPDWHLTVKAAECESQQDWNGAEAAYEEILALAGDSPSGLYKAHRNLAALYEFLNRPQAALEHSELAVKAARSQDVTILLLMALRNHVADLLQFGRIEAAQIFADEAVSLLNEDRDPRYDTIRGAVLALRAHCRFQTDRIGDAEEDLREAFALLQPMEGLESGGGVRSAFARAWSVKARLETSQLNFADAAEAWEKSVALRKSVAQMPHCADVYSVAAVADALHDLSAALFRANRVEAAQLAEAERSEILAFLRLPDRDASA